MPPPKVDCDKTPPPAVLSMVPLLVTAADIPANDAWKAEAIGAYTGEVVIRQSEHACWDELRARGVIR